VTEILTDGATPTVAARVKGAPRTKSKAAETAEAAPAS
jgi:hypothetical protein